MPDVTLEITSTELQRLSEQSVRFYLALDRSAEQIAIIYHVAPSKVEKIIRQIELAAAKVQAQAETQARLTARVLGGRPLPSADLCDLGNPATQFAPAHDLEEWIRATFIEGDGPLVNPDHSHLRFARLGFLWTNVPNSRGMRAIVGQAEIPRGQGGKWAKGRADFQLCQWFGEVPNFLITLSTLYSVRASDAAFCALAEHELYHCAQALDPWDEPRWTEEGFPVYALKGHDIEEHIGVVRRYGVGNAAAGTAEFVRAANAAPQIAAADIAQACGTCR